MLHVSLKEFKKPIYTIETSKFIVRIDLLEKRRFRYASWSKGAKLSKKPSLVLNNGVWMAEGTGGNHHYKFTNGQYTYIVYANVLGSHEQPRIYFGFPDKGMIHPHLSYQIIFNNQYVHHDIYFLF